MKKNIQKLILITVLSIGINMLIKSQTVSDFENLTLTADSYWNGSDTPLGTSFTSGNAIFPNFYDTAWGGYWQSGWAYSNMKDTLTSSFLNMYSVISGTGYNNSNNFAVATQGSVITLTGTALGKVVAGFFVNNGTYAALSMRDGDFSAKKFGGTTGDDPDWFKLTIHAYYNDTLKDDSVEFYLADYRFTDNQDDYIVNTWQWVDLSTLGNVDSLVYSLSSTDNGTWGMNTPAFFCIDNFITLNSEVGLSNNKINTPEIMIYPNPVSHLLNIKHQNITGVSRIQIFNVRGQLMLQQEITDSDACISVNNLLKGVYYVHFINTNFVHTESFIKE